MNKVILIGRLTRDPEVRYSQGDNSMAIARYAIAVNRRFADKDGKYHADFINCIAFAKAGEFAEKYFWKGIKVAIAGRIQTGSYTNKDGIKIYTTDVVVEEQEFAESKNADNNREQRDHAAMQAAGYSDHPVPDTGDGFVPIQDGIEDDLPFN